MNKLIFVFFIAIWTSAFGQTMPRTAQSPEDFIPSGYVVFDKVLGDLNKDNQEDYVFVIKEAKKSNVVKNRFGEKVDRNRRGIVIALKKDNQYELVLENRDCFSSENEDGGVYFSPELGIFIEKGILRVHYFHGRYGYTTYKFRYQNSDFEMIGYDDSQNRGPLVERTTSINLTTKKMLIRENINLDAEDGDEKFKETWKKLTLSKPIKLREIADFDSLDVKTLLHLIK